MFSLTTKKNKIVTGLTVTAMVGTTILAGAALAPIAILGGIFTVGGSGLLTTAGLMAASGLGAGTVVDTLAETLIPDQEARDALRAMKEKIDDVSSRDIEVPNS